MPAACQGGKPLGGEPGVEIGAVISDERMQMREGGLRLRLAAEFLVGPGEACQLEIALGPCTALVRRRVIALQLLHDFLIEMVATRIGWPQRGGMAQGHVGVVKAALVGEYFGQHLERLGRERGNHAMERGPRPDLTVGSDLAGSNDALNGAGTSRVARI